MVAVATVAGSGATISGWPAEADGTAPLGVALCVGSPSEITRRTPSTAATIKIATAPSPTSRVIKVVIARPNEPPPRWGARCDV